MSYDRQCSSCGGFCGRGGCKRENVKVNDIIETGNSVLLNKQAYLLRKCRAALDEILAAKPRLAAGYYECGNMKDTIGNLRAELYDYRLQGVFGIGSGLNEQAT